MEGDLDINIIKATQTSLGKYVKRPPLSEKLLKKPPFRFIHDIVTSVLKTTGFFNGLFEDNELISDNVKDRDAKVAFLTKTIFVIAQTTGKKLSVKPSKIVAGQEPEKTNELFQCLAEALDNNLKSDEAVETFKKTKGVSTNEKKKEIKVESKKSPPKKKDQGTKSDKNQTIKDKLKENNKVGNESSTKKITSQNKVKSNDKKVTQHNYVKNEPKKKGLEFNPNPNDSIDICNKDYNNSNVDESNNAFETVENNKDDLNIKHDKKTSVAESQISILTSQDLSPKLNELSETYVDSHEKIFETNNIVEDEVNNRDSRFINTEEIVKDDSNLSKETTNNEYTESDTFSHKNNNDSVETSTRTSSARPTSSRPSAPRIREKYYDKDIISGNNSTVVGKVNIISENIFPEEEEETSIIIQNSSDLDAIPQQIEASSKNDHGHLVQQILDSQKEFSNVSGKTDIEWQFEAQKARDDINKDIEQLRFNIQALSRIANPLGKLLDHIQEDVEVMRQESLQWIQTFEETTKELYKQKAANEDLMLPLHSKIKQLDAELIEKREKIIDLKIIIHKNNMRIERLLTNGNVQ